MQGSQEEQGITYTVLNTAENLQPAGAFPAYPPASGEEEDAPKGQEEKRAPATA